LFTPGWARGRPLAQLLEMSGHKLAKFRVSHGRKFFDDLARSLFVGHFSPRSWCVTELLRRSPATMIAADSIPQM
jgi:hypothetical protein